MFGQIRSLRGKHLGPEMQTDGEGRPAAGLGLDLERAMMQLDELEHQREADAAALVTASTYAVYRMSADWTEMLQLDTPDPSSRWLGNYIHPDDQAVVTRRDPQGD